MKRSKHSLSHYKLFTCDMGQLIPIGCYEVLPGDTIQHATSLLVRVSPLLAPVMHPVVVRVHHWFVPHRLVWTGWEQFITGGNDGLGGSAGSFPTLNSGVSGFANGSVLDYMGVPPTVSNVSVSALPVRSYNKIYNENYRDEDMVPALNVPVSSGVDTGSNTSVQNIAWEKDRFTMSRPWAQKGPAVTLPLGVSAPVYGNGTTPPTMQSSGLASATNLNLTNGNIAIHAGAAPTGSAPLFWIDPQLVADLSAATSVDVNDVREAFAVQRYQEARARYGDRYTEYLAYLGVRSSDARLQRPEYLGGGKQTISFTEVLQTGTNFDANTGVASLKGHGLAAARSRRYRRFFEEHGLVITLLSVRPRTMYVNGVDKMWTRRAKEDYWQRELEHIGQEEVKLSEVWAPAADSANTSVFGYGDRYYSYRNIPNNVAGEFRSSALNFWHMARIFAAQPALNSSFIQCDPTTRIYASAATDSLWCMASHSIQARRLVSRSASGRIY